MRKTFTHRALFSVLFILLGFGVSCANDGIGVSLVTYTIENGNTASPGYTITISALLTNFDSVPFHDTINFGLRGNHQNLTTAGVFGTPRYSGSDIYLHGYETVPAIFSVQVEQQYFAPGPAVVVVWPICVGPFSDSVVINFTVADPNGIAVEKNDPFSYIVLSDRVLLKNAEGSKLFKQAKIYNMLGQQVFELQAGVITEIAVPALPKGIYLCELLAADNTRKVIKFLH